MSIFRLYIPYGDRPWWGPLWLPSLVVAVLIVAVNERLTGALHLDGLADMADGFGGGHTREDVLRIMRDHVIGSYGAVALILLVLLKVAALSTLINDDGDATYLILAPVLGRWASTPLGHFLPYARRRIGDFLMMSTAGGCIPRSAICRPRNSSNNAGCSKQKTKRNHY
jgi:cobalamin synthase